MPITTIEVYPKKGETYPDAAGVPITSVGALVNESKYIQDALRDGFLLTWDPLEIYEPDDRTSLVVDAPSNAAYIVASPDAILTNELVLTQGANITLTPGPGTLTVASAGSPDAVVGPASSTDSAVMLFSGTTGKLAKNSAVTINAGGDITTPGLVDGVDVSGLATTVAAKAPLSTPYLTLSADATLPNERVLTQGPGIAFADGGAGGALTIAQNTPVNGFAATSYTLALSDAGKLVAITDALGVVLTIPQNAAVAFPVGTIIYVRQNAGGPITFSSSAQLLPPAGTALRTSGQYGIVTLLKTGTDQWTLTGDLAPVVTASGTGNLNTVAAGGIISFTSASAQILTIQPASTIAHAIGPTTTLIQSGTGAVTVSPGSGVTLNVPAGFSAKLRNQYSRATVTQVSADVWDLNGDLEATGGGSSAPLAASYLTLSADGTLPNERVLTQGPGIAFADAGAGGALKLSRVAEPINPSNGNYTLTAADAGKLLISSNNTNVNWTIPAGVLPVGTVTYVWQSSAGQITLVGSGGMVLQGTPSLKTRTQHSLVAICPAFSNSANVSGDLEGARGNQELVVSRTLPYTLASSDAGTYIQASNGTLTIPLNASVPFAVGTTIRVLQDSASGPVAFSTSAQLNFPPGKVAKTAGVGAEVWLVKRALPDYWVLEGELEDATAYVTIGNTTALPNERALTQGPGISITDGGAGGAVTVSGNVPWLELTGAAHTISAAHYGKVIYTQSANPVYTVPSLTGAGHELYIFQHGTTQVTLQASGTTLLAPPDRALRTRAQNSFVRLRHAVDQYWAVDGDLDSSAAAGGGYYETAATDYTLQLSDAGKIIGFTSAASYVRVPPNVFPVGTKVWVVQASTVTTSELQIEEVGEASGVTFHTPARRTRQTGGGWALVCLEQTELNEWTLSGGLDDEAGYFSFGTTNNPYAWSLEPGTGLAFREEPGQVIFIDAAGGSALLVPKSLAGWPYNPILTDAGKLLHNAAIGGGSITLPSNATTAFPIGTVLEVMNTYASTSNISFTQGSGATLRYPDDRSASTRTYMSRAQAIKTNTNEWTITGDLAPWAASRDDSGTSITLGNLNANRILNCTAATAVTVTILASQPSLPVYTWADIIQSGAGQVTVSPGASVTLRNAGLSNKTRTQYSRISLFHVGSNVWHLSGDLAVS